MIIKREEAEKDAVLNVAEFMVSAARTAPKGHGIDNIEALILDGDEKDAVTNELTKIAEETGADFYRRDGQNIKNSQYLVLLAVKNDPILLPDCGMCGFKDCAEMKKAGAICVFNITDLGIAVGSAVSIAADHRIDNRVFFSAGRAAIRLGLFSENVTVCYGIPLSTHGKSPYFDRG